MRADQIVLSLRFVHASTVPRPNAHDYTTRADQGLTQACRQGVGWEPNVGWEPDEASNVAWEPDEASNQACAEGPPGDAALDAAPVGTWEGTPPSTLTTGGAEGEQERSGARGGQVP